MAAVQKAVRSIQSAAAAECPRLTRFALHPAKSVISGRHHVGIMLAEPVGNYGVRLFFDDLHKTGIYSWDYFYHLGINKFTLMRNYVKTLKKHGLIRDPPRRR